MSDPTRKQLRKAAGRRSGVYNRRLALDAGLTDPMIRREVTAGIARRLAAGRFALEGAPSTWEQELHAAVLGIGGLGGVGYLAAAAFWRLTGYDPSPPEVLVPVGAGTRNPLTVVHRSRNLSPVDFTRVGGLPVTTPARTLVDLASVEPNREHFLRAFDDAICRRLATVEQIARTAERVIKGPRRGGSLIDAGLSTWSDGPLPDVFGEMTVVRLLVEAGYPEPVRQHTIYAADGRKIGRVDCAYPWAKLAIERDSQRWHGGNRAVDRDVRRELEIQAAGWTVRRVTQREVAEGGARFLAAVEVVLRPFLDAGAHLRAAAS